MVDYYCNDMHCEETAIKTIVLMSQKKELQQRVASPMAISLWSGEIIFPLSSCSPVDRIDMDDEGGDDV